MFSLRNPRRWIILGTAVIALSVTGCSGDDDGGTPAKAAGPEVAWAGSLCTSLGGKASQLQMPSLDPKDGAKAKAGIVTFLGQISMQLGFMETSLKAAGAPPVTEASPLYDAALKRVTTTRKSVEDAAKSLGKSKVTDQKSLQKTLDGLGQVMLKYQGYQGPIHDLKSNSDLKAAFAQAPTCANVS